MACAAVAIVTGFPAGGLRVVPRRIRVLSVDGHQLVQEGLAAMINREDDMTVVATASSGEEALQDVRRYRPDVRGHAMRAIEQPEQAKHSAADLCWLISLLTGCREIPVNMTLTGIASSGKAGFFSTWMSAWSRRIVISKALTTIREDLARSARRTALRRRESSELPPPGWVIHPQTTKADVERPGSD